MTDQEWSDFKWGAAEAIPFDAYSMLYSLKGIDAGSYLNPSVPSLGQAAGLPTPDELFGEASSARQGGRFMASFLAGGALASLHAPPALRGPVVTAGGGAEITNIAAGDLRRIMNAVERRRVTVNVIGSRARGEAHGMSDWDYILEGGTGRNRSRIKNSLPEGDFRPQHGLPTRDFVNRPLDRNLPYIRIEPGP